jgi:hypothetical protein
VGGAIPDGHQRGGVAWRARLRKQPGVTFGGTARDDGDVSGPGDAFWFGEVAEERIDGRSLAFGFVGFEEAPGKQHFLYFLPLPQGQGSLRLVFGVGRRCGIGLIVVPVVSVSGDWFSLFNVRGSSGVGLASFAGRAFGVVGLSGICGISTLFRGSKWELLPKSRSLAA